MTEKVTVSRSCLDRVLVGSGFEAREGIIRKGEIEIGRFDPTVHGYSTVTMGQDIPPAREFLTALGTADAALLLRKWESNASSQSAPVGA